MKKSEINQLKIILNKLKTPKDIKALHDVNVILDIINCGKLLSNHLKDFKNDFIDSFAMSADDILSEIPEKKWNDYKLDSEYYKLYDFELCISYPVKNDDSKKLPDKEIAKIESNIKSEILSHYSQYKFDITKIKNTNFLSCNDLIFKFEFNNIDSLQEKLYLINKTDKCFYIDHKNKKIELNWSLCKPVINNITVSKGYNIRNYTNNRPDLFEAGYSSLNEKTNIINYHCEYSNSIQKYIKRDSSWYSGQRTHEYETISKTLTVNHEFCMNTNVYLGAKIDISKPYRDDFSLYNFDVFYNLQRNEKFDINNIITVINRYFKSKLIQTYKFIEE